MKGVWSCVWRGALGGIMGSIILLLLSALNYRLTLGYIPYSYLFIVAGLAVALPVGIMIGAIIGVVVRLLEFKTERSLGVVMRALAGGIIALIASFGMSSSSAKRASEKLWTGHFQTAQHQSDHGQVYERLTGFRKIFIVSGQTPMLHQPAECALDYPPLRQHRKALPVTGTLYHLQQNSPSLSHVPQPARQVIFPVSRICPDMA